MVQTKILNLHLQIHPSYFNIILGNINFDAKRTGHGKRVYAEL